MSFLPILKCNLSVSFNIKTCSLGVLLFSEFINIVSILYVDGFDYVIVYFFSDLFWLMQRIKNLPDSI